MNGGLSFVEFYFNLQATTCNSAKFDIKESNFPSAEASALSNKNIYNSFVIPKVT